jgi:hypothetical protein
MTKTNERKFNRSGIQVCPICKNKSVLVEHHINGREIKDANAGFNISWICASCHDLVHIGQIEIEGWMRTTDGRELFFHQRGEPPKVKDVATPPLYGK